MIHILYITEKNIITWYLPVFLLGKILRHKQEQRSSEDGEMRFSTLRIFYLLCK